ncbi:MAG: hypothetical protein WC601_05890 [Desulfotomaculaceae bacterium]
MDFENMTIPERADHCQNIYLKDGDKGVPKCSDNFLNNQQCDNICCGHCQDYLTCEEEKCRKVWINPRLIIADPVGRLIYVVLATGQLVSGSIPCIISEMYDDNEEKT